MELIDSDEEMLKNLKENIERVKRDIEYYENKIRRSRFDLKVLEVYKKSQFGDDFDE